MSEEDAIIERMKQQLESALLGELDKPATPLTVETIKQAVGSYVASVFDAEAPQHIRIDDVTSLRDHADRRLSINIVPLTAVGEVIVARLRELNQGRDT